ncbi:MAG: hypothetical protein J7L66_01535 [Anaerolineaceae bacterium]|nr:hypothetical protein [Anaerolineaceae bacterium]
MDKKDWFKILPIGIMISNAEGTILEMNDKCVENYSGAGGNALLGKNAITCHQGASLEKVKKLYNHPFLNVYTINKKGKKKLIYQCPYFIDSEFAGMIELSLPIPEDIPHFNRPMD